MGTTNNKAVVVGVTGASGSLYGKRFLELLANRDIVVHYTISDSAVEVIQEELGVGLDVRSSHPIQPLLGYAPGNFVYHPLKNFKSIIASGSSFPSQGMIVIPCSMGTLSGIVTGTSANVIERAADVALKERRRLVVVPRETPLNAVHLQNMLALTQMGGIVLAAMPAFYTKPKSMDDLVTGIVNRALSLLDLSEFIQNPMSYQPGR